MDLRTTVQIEQFSNFSPNLRLLVRKGGEDDASEN